MKVLASDFDGTIYFKGEFKAEDIKAIKEFQKQGHLFGMCTGRPLRGVSVPVADRIKFDFYILNTGALILDGNENILYQALMSKELTKDICETYKNQTNMMIIANKHIYRFSDILFLGDEIMIKNVDDITEDEIYSISLNCFNEEKAKIIVNELNKKYKDISAYQNKEYIDVVKKGCSKGRAIKMLKDILKVDKICGIGDSYNDLPMLDEADLSFSFIDSPEDVKSHATVLVESVAQAIQFLTK